MSRLQNLYVFLLFLISLQIYSCVPSNEIVGNNSLDNAFESTYTKIQKGKSKSKNIKILNEQLIRIIADISMKKDNLNLNTLEGKDQLFELNNYLAEKILKSTPYIGNRYSTKLDSLNNEKELLKTELKKSYYDFGKSELETAEKSNDKIKSQAAYLAFQKAEKYGNSATDLEELKTKSKALSFFVYNIRTNVEFDERYDFLVNERFREVETINRNFKKIYYNRKNLENVDCQVDIIFDPLQIVNDIRESSSSHAAKVATGSKITTNSDGSESETTTYSTVRATLLKKTEIRTYQWNVKVQVTPKSNNCQLVGKIFTENVKASSTEIDVTGDDRAIPAHLLSSNDADIIIDSEQVDLLIEKIYQQIELIVL